ncbi:hypothetical protein D3C81_2017070 [compost metagenome]
MNLCRRGTGVLFLQMNDAVVTHLSTSVDQAPLRIKDRRLLFTRVQARDGQQYLNIRGEASGCRGQHHALAVQITGDPTQ